jgi:hypothetical protein
MNKCFAPFYDDTLVQNLKCVDFKNEKLKKLFFIHTKIYEGGAMKSLLS